MILSLIGVALLVVGIVLVVKFEYEVPDFIKAVCIIFGFILTVVCSVLIASSNIGLDSIIASWQAKRETIVYQLNNHTYENDNNIGTVELMDRVAEFNGAIESDKAFRNNPWTSWCTSKACMYVEPIDIEEYQN